jgi:hypothetical protein
LAPLTAARVPLRDAEDPRDDEEERLDDDERPELDDDERFGAGMRGSSMT